MWSLGLTTKNPQPVKPQIPARTHYHYHPPPLPTRPTPPRIGRQSHQIGKSELSKDATHTPYGKFETIASFSCASPRLGYSYVCTYDLHKGRLGYFPTWTITIHLIMVRRSFYFILRSVEPTKKRGNKEKKKAGPKLGTVHCSRAQY